MSPEILVGHRYLWRHLEVVIESIERDRCVVKYERDGKEVMRSVRQSEIEAIPEHPDFDDHPLALIDPGDWRQANERATELEKIAALTSGKSEAVAAAATKLGLSGRQVWRLLTIYEQNPTKTALLAGRPGRPFDLRLLGTAREDLIAECIETHYLREERPTVKALWRAIEARCGERGLTVPSYRTVRRRVERLALKMATRRRRGTKAAGELCDGVPGSLAVPHLLDRVEIDHTLVDVILRADTPRREVVGRPWLTVAVDCRSRMVLGFYISFEKPSAASVAMCLAMAALPKETWLETMGIARAWPAFGIPRQIWVDNALEFRSLAMQRGCEQHGIVLCFRPVGSPRYGGIVERLIGTLMGHVHLLPGTTQSSVADLENYEAEKRATMTLSEFIPWFTEQVVTQYHMTEHREIGLPPIKKWEQEVAESQRRNPRDTLEFYASFLPGQKRRLTRVGVQLAAETYWTDEFSPWIGQKKTVLVHFHRMDAARVYVRLPDGRIAIAENSDKALSGKTFEDLKQMRGHNRAESADPVLKAQRLAGFRRNEERTKQAMQQTSAALRARPERPGNPPVPPVGPPPPALTVTDTPAEELSVVELD
jgi:putative transposase